MSKSNEVAILTIDAKQLVTEAQQRHQLSPTATAALGRTLMGGVLMSCFRKAGESLQITFMASGVLKGIQVVAESNGYVKGKVGNPLADLPLRGDGKLDVGRAVGDGALLTLDLHQVFWDLE
jgi:molecular chaperone Hsp33